MPFELSMDCSKFGRYTAAIRVYGHSTCIRAVYERKEKKITLNFFVLCVGCYILPTLQKFRPRNLDHTCVCERLRILLPDDVLALPGTLLDSVMRP